MKEKTKMVTVIATATGHDGLVVRQAGEEFTVPATMFDKRPKLDDKGKPTGFFYDSPSWFRKKSPEREAAVAARQKATNARVIADASPGDKNLANKADDLDEAATNAEKKADTLDAKADEGTDLV